MTMVRIKVAIRLSPNLTVEGDSRSTISWAKLDAAAIWRLANVAEI